MQVNAYDVDDNGAETLRARNVYLRDLTGDDAEAYASAKNELEKAGRCWIGGGASPLIYLARCVLTKR